MSDRPGPVHLNFAFREPLLPDGELPDDLELVPGRDGGRPWVTLALAGACLLMAAARRRPAVLSSTSVGLAIFFVTVAVPLEFHGTGVTLCWLGEALTLVALARL